MDFTEATIYLQNETTRGNAFQPDKVEFIRHGNNYKDDMTIILTLGSNIVEWRITGKEAETFRAALNNLWQSQPADDPQYANRGENIMAAIRVQAQGMARA